MLPERSLLGGNIVYVLGKASCSVSDNTTIALSRLRLLLFFFSIHSHLRATNYSTLFLFRGGYGNGDEDGAGDSRRYQGGYQGGGYGDKGSAGPRECRVKTARTRPGPLLMAKKKRTDENALFILLERFTPSKTIVRS